MGTYQSRYSSFDTMSLPGFLSVQILTVSVIIGTDGYYVSRRAKCSFRSSDLSDMEYTDSVLFGRRVEFEFKSSLGWYVGYTEGGIKSAEFWNNNSRVEEMRAQVKNCKDMANERINSLMSKTVEPKVKLRSVKQAEDSHVSTLMCSAYNFYPKNIEVSWLRDSRKVTDGVTSSEELPDGDWYYQTHSSLEYIPKAGEKISCLVEHVSLKRPMIYEWDPSLSEVEKKEIAVGATGLLLGAVTTAAGLTYYMKKGTGRILVPLVLE